MNTKHIIDGAHFLELVAYRLRVLCGVSEARMTVFMAWKFKSIPDCISWSYPYFFLLLLLLLTDVLLLCFVTWKVSVLVQNLVPPLTYHVTLGRLYNLCLSFLICKMKITSFYFTW